MAFNNPDKTAANASRFEQAQDYEELNFFSELLHKTAEILNRHKDTDLVLNKTDVKNA